MMPGPGWLMLLFFIAGAALVTAVAVTAWQAERKRVREIAAACAASGFAFSPGRDRGLSKRFAFVSDIDNGSNRYAFDVVRGTWNGLPAIAFDHHYEIRSSSGKGGSRTSHHHHRVFALDLGTAFPGLRITPEGAFSKIAQALGYDDIDFESHEFSRLYCVRSKDRRFAYDFCHPRLIEFLLARPGTRLFLDGALLATVLDGRMQASDLPARLQPLLDVRRLVPDYLLA